MRSAPRRARLSPKKRPKLNRNTFGICITSTPRRPRTNLQKRQQQSKAWPCCLVPRSEARDWRPKATATSEITHIPNYGLSTVKSVNSANNIKYNLTSPNCEVKVVQVLVFDLVSDMGDRRQHLR